MVDSCTLAQLTCKIQFNFWKKKKSLDLNLISKRHFRKKKKFKPLFVLHSKFTLTFEREKKSLFCVCIRAAFFYGKILQSNTYEFNAVHIK